MPRWPQAPDAEVKIQLAIKAYKLGHYKSKEGCAKAYNIDPNIFRRRLSRKQRSYQIAHTNQYRNMRIVSPLTKILTRGYKPIN